jgi:hypothetical protein
MPKAPWYSRIEILLLAALALQGGLIAEGIWGGGYPMGDLPFAYQPWVEYILHGGGWLGINTEWVYPFPALLPMFAAYFVAPGNLQTGWLILAVLANTATLGWLANWERDPNSERTKRGTLAAWFVLAFIFVIGPVSLSRLETVTLLLSLVGMMALEKNRIGTATAWFTAGVWIKIWPVAPLLALVAAAQRRFRVVAAAGLASLGVIVVGLLLGGNGSLFGFLGVQSGRGIQIEAPIAQWWLWQGVAHVKDAGLYYDGSMYTFQVKGLWVAQAATLIGLAQVVALAITGILAFLAARRGTDWRTVVTVATLTGVLDLIVFNKVGSPQYMMWLALPAAMGLYFGVKRWRLYVVYVLALGFVTWLIYPRFYGSILNLEPAGVALLGFRNLAAIVLLVLANIRLTRMRPELEV